MQDNTVAVSLSKALKLKNRLAGRLNKATTTITQYNSVYESRGREVNVLELDRLRDELVKALVTLKTEIFKANSGVYQYIVELGEKKSEVEFLISLSTRSGSEPGYSGTAIVYACAITAAEVAGRVKRLEKEIDDLQDKIDGYNAVSDRVRVPLRVLELAS